MDAINILWQVGILSAVLIFGIKLGLATGLANMSKRYLALVSIGYGGGVLILTEISSFFTKQITDLIYTYNFEFFLIMAIIMILAGIFTIREYKVFEKNTTAATCMAVVAPCPCWINYCKYNACGSYCRFRFNGFKFCCCRSFSVNNCINIFRFKLLS